jgi:hypothetical protein
MAAEGPLPSATTSNDTDAYDELPDWKELYKQAGGNATELDLRAEYLREWRHHHENDPEVKYAVLIFYAIMVRIPTHRIRPALRISFPPPHTSWHRVKVAGGGLEWRAALCQPSVDGSLWKQCPHSDTNVSSKF